MVDVLGARCRICSMNSQNERVHCVLAWIFRRRNSKRYYAIYQTRFGGFIHLYRRNEGHGASLRNSGLLTPSEQYTRIYGPDGGPSAR